MSNLFLTLVIAFVILVLAIAALAIGWLITGKTKIERGACGRDPTKKRDDQCETTSCDLCSDSQKDKSTNPQIFKEDSSKE